MTNQPLTAERDIDDFVAEVISIIATTDDLMDTDLAPVFKAYAAQEVAKATTGLQSHNSLLADSLKTVIENCEHYLIGEASMGGAYVENNFTGVGHEALDATAEIIRQWESRIEMRMAFKVGDKLAAQVVELETELEQLRKGKPITHNGKEYWPDANGWYDIACATETRTGPSILIGSYEDDEIVKVPSGAWLCDYIYGEYPTHKVWQPLPAGPVMEGG